MCSPNYSSCITSCANSHNALLALLLANSAAIKWLTLFYHKSLVKKWRTDVLRHPSLLYILLPRSVRFFYFFIFL